MSVFTVVQPGLFTTIQDLGRPHAIASGVPSGGAMDRFAHRAGNLLVGNAPGDATLECTLKGPHFAVERDCLVAITGADLDPQLNGAPAPMWTSFLVAAGDRITFGGRRAGARAYVAVAGGVQGERWLGSVSTYVLVGRGGMAGRALAAGDSLSVAREAGGLSRPGRELDRRLRPDYSDHTLHAIAGPHLKRLDAGGRQALFGASFSVSHQSDRMGYRLDGATLEMSGEELLSFGLAVGAIQVPGGGRPILLMADHHTAGGYPVPAVVATASLPVAAQLAPGDELRFAEVSVETAVEMRSAALKALETLNA